MRWLALAILLFTVSASAEVGVEQVTQGPYHHFYGYIGHVGNTPWNASGRYMVLLRTDFQDRMPAPGEKADIVLLDTQDGYRARKVEESRGWNPQQGTMLYWNPQAPETQFFFNDRDRETHKLFCVLYDIEQGERLKEYRFEDTPVGNSGVSWSGDYFLGMNYGRLARLREVTGYPGAYDWTEGDVAPENDGVWKVDVATGEKELLVSYAALAEGIRPVRPDVDKIPLFINHTLWSRDDARVLLYLRGWWTNRGDGPRINTMYIVNGDGTNLTRHETFPGGHPEWGPGHELIGTVDRRQVFYDVDRQTITRTIGDRKVFRDPEGDIALSPDGRWFVNGYKKRDKSVYVIYDLKTEKHFEVEGFARGKYLSGPLRIDPAPCWRRDGRALAIPALAADGTRQTFLIHVGEKLDQLGEDE